MVGHMGAVYGFTSSVQALPEQKLGVVVLANADLAVGPVRRLARGALEALLEARGAAPRAAAAASGPLQAENLAELAGEYESTSYWARIAVDGGRLAAVVSGQPVELTSQGGLAWMAEGRILRAEPLVFERDARGAIGGFTLLRQKFSRAREETAPAAWRQYLGSYGPEYIPLIVSVRHGHLYAMTENEFDYRLTPINRRTFAMPPGMYADEQVVFECDAQGRAHTALLANMPLRRRPEAGGER
jgi:hypothetical protein